MDIRDFVNLSARGWAPVFLRLLAKGHPGRQAALLHHSGAPRSGFASAMGRLIELELVMRNPGHGHPMRPEFLITQKGRQMAQALDGLPEIKELAVLRRNWSLPVLAALQKPMPFSRLGARLRPITDRALSQSLKSLEGEGLVCRQVEIDARPPRPLYLRTSLGAQIAGPLDGQIVWS